MSRAWKVQWSNLGREESESLYSVRSCLYISHMVPNTSRQLNFLLFFNDSFCIIELLWKETNKNLLLLSCWWACGVDMWPHTHTHTDAQRQCMIHSSIEGAGMIHPDPSCGSDIKAAAATVWVTMSVDLKKRKTVLLDSVSPWGPNSALQQRTHPPWTGLFSFSSSLWSETHNVRMYNSNITKKKICKTHSSIWFNFPLILLLQIAFVFTLPCWFIFWIVFTLLESVFFLTDMLFCSTY